MLTIAGGIILALVLIGLAIFAFNLMVEFAIACAEEIANVKAFAGRVYRRFARSS